MERKDVFVRPSSMPKGVIDRYSTFRIEDIPDNRREEVIDHMINYFFKDEPMAEVLMNEAPYSKEDICAFINSTLNENVSIFAVDESRNEEIAGVSILHVLSRSAPNQFEKADSSLKSMQELSYFLEYCYDGIDLFTYDSGSSKVTVDYVLKPLGLSVSRDYRGKGIGEALIKARHKLVLNMGVGATIGLYTGIFSQAIISRLPGLSTRKEIMYKDYVKDGKVLFARMNPLHPSAKVIGGLLTKDMA